MRVRDRHAPRQRASNRRARIQSQRSTTEFEDRAISRRRCRCATSSSSCPNRFPRTSRLRWFPMTPRNIKECSEWGPVTYLLTSPGSLAHGSKDRHCTARYCQRQRPRQSELTFWEMSFAVRRMARMVSLIDSAIGVSMYGHVNAAATLSVDMIGADRSTM
jgi:hypothetical protein